jgi:hypothetical protein
MVSAVHLPVELPGDEGTLSPVVPVVESLSRAVVMLPATKDICGDGIEIVTAVLVAIIVVVTAGEGLARIGMIGRRVTIATLWI